MAIYVEEIITGLYGQRGPCDFVKEVTGIAGEGDLPDFGPEMIDFHRRTKDGQPRIGKPYVAELILKGVGNSEATDAFFKGVGFLDHQIEQRSPFAFKLDRLEKIIEHENDHLRVIREAGLGDQFDLALMRIIKETIGPLMRNICGSGFNIKPPLGVNIPLETDLRISLAPKIPSSADIRRARLIIPALFKSSDDPRLQEPGFVELERKFVGGGGKPFRELILEPKRDLTKMRLSAKGHFEDDFDTVLSQGVIVKDSLGKEKIPLNTA